MSDTPVRIRIIIDLDPAGTYDGRFPLNVLTAIAEEARVCLPGWRVVDCTVGRVWR